MKKIVLLALFGAFLLSGCGGIKTLSSGLENEAYLEFIGAPNDYSGGVDVIIDDTNIFKAEVHKDLARKVKSEVYAISTGTHKIAVSYNGKLLFQKQIFISAQETKKIVLP
ncbi:MAG TPA: hypothetical protein PLT53_11225 [Prolixibacteraceae bacterium]|jgi:hypothetical protein|nr:hypothetical protein [Bacteroidales bacterium]HPV19668.1 hypothetical protein [Prolixibacteraceae bacterium]HPY28639.1 hypothetical protein [Prolixibacteraceae bacterium]HQL19870.1 hypothetical protein [Prolixibacteraceae bacterium]